MIVNGATTGSAAAQAQWYHLTFDFGASGFDSLQLLNRDSGQIDLIPLTHLSGSQYSLDWNLEGGTGDLMRFWNSSVPEPGALGVLLLVTGAALLSRRREPT